MAQNDKLQFQKHTQKFEPQLPHDQFELEIQANIMDQLSDIYVNAEGPSGHRKKWKREIENSENIYENEDKFNALEPNRTEPAVSGNEHLKQIHRFTHTLIFFTYRHTQTLKWSERWGYVKQRQNQEQ